MNADQTVTEQVEAVQDEAPKQVQIKIVRGDNGAVGLAFDLETDRVWMAPREARRLAEGLRQVSYGAEVPPTRQKRRR